MAQISQQISADELKLFSIPVVIVVNVPIRSPEKASIGLLYGGDGWPQGWLLAMASAPLRRRTASVNT
jgi:hypothetical protein